MFKKINTKKEEAVIAMESRDHLSNGVSPKDHTNRVNQLKVFAIVLFCSLFTLTTLHSCDKSKKLDGTTWEGECGFDDPTEGNITHEGTVSISFTSENADIIAKFKVKDTYYGGTENETHKGTATYTCEKNNISIKIKWDGEMYGLDDGKWNGTFDETIITLKNVFGETVKFKKQ